MLISLSRIIFCSGHRTLSFCTYAPRLWKELPDNIKAADSVQNFKKQLKTLLNFERSLFDYCRMANFPVCFIFPFFPECYQTGINNTGKIITLHVRN